MRIQQSAFLVNHPFGTFLGIVAFDADTMSATTAARREWGTKAQTKELTAEEMLGYTRAGISVFTATVQE